VASNLDFADLTQPTRRFDIVKIENRKKSWSKYNEERKMKKRLFCAIILIYISVFAFGSYAATVKIDPPTQASPPAGGTISVDVKVENVIGMYGYQLELVFDSTALKFSSIEEGEFLGKDEASTFAFLLVNGQMVEFQNITPDIAAQVNSAGMLSVASTRIGKETSVDGTGRLATVKFQVLQSKDSTIELQNVMLANSDGETISVDVEDGAVETGISVIKGDVSGDGQVRSNDAILTLRIASQLIQPTEEEFEAADYNGDGKVRSNDAILILRVAAGLPVTAPGKDIVAGRNITIALGEAHGVAGESITLPVMVDNVHALAGGDISISYDQTVLRALDVSSDPNTLMVSNLSQPGTVRIAFANADRQIDKTVAKIQFQILADDLSPLKLVMMDLYGYDALPLMSRGIDREFRSWAIPPEHSALLQNFPNPFNPETWIPYQLKNASEVTIQIYNVAGEMIRKLDLGYKSAGLYVSQDRAAYWDGRNRFGMSVTSGVYFYSIHAGDFTAVKKLIILK
jgi:hypothetical protein